MTITSTASTRTSARRGGNRITVPAEAQRVCASCGAPRGNVRRGWEPILRGGSVVVGWTCSECPTAAEPIRRVASERGGVRFRSTMHTDPANGGRTVRKQTTRTFPTLEAAREWVEEVRAVVQEKRQRWSEPEAAPTVTLSALADRWLASRVDIRQITREGYKGSLSPVRRHLGERDVATLTKADLRGLVSWLAERGSRPTKTCPDGRPMQPRSVRASLVAVAQVLDLAVEDGLLLANPARGAKLPRQAAKRGTDLEHWQPSELLAFRDHADSDPLAAAWRLTLCGMTRADVMGLRWSDVGLDAGTATIAQGRVQLQDGGQRAHVDAPKSAQRRRVVPFEAIHPGTVALLKALRASQAADKLAAGAAYRDSGYVVVDAIGTPLRPEYYGDLFRRLCKAAGVPSIHLHSVRHSLAFAMHQQGVSPADAAALLGHTVEVHLSTYLPASGSTGIAAAAAALGRVSAAG